MKEEEILLRELLIIYEYTNVEYELLNHYRDSFIFARFISHYRLRILINKIEDCFITTISNTKTNLTKNIP